MDNIVIYMKKWGLIIAIISVLSFKVKAQRKIIFDLNVGINKSIGANLLKTESILGNDVQYYSTQRYKYPYANVTSSALFRINKDFYLGLRSGLYIYLPVVRLENKVKKMLCHHSLVWFLLVIV